MSENNSIDYQTQVVEALMLLLEERGFNCARGALESGQPVFYAEGTYWTLGISVQDGKIYTLYTNCPCFDISLADPRCIDKLEKVVKLCTSRPHCPDDAKICYREICDDKDKK